MLHAARRVLAAGDSGVEVTGLGLFPALCKQETPDLDRRQNLGWPSALLQDDLSIY